MSDTESLIGSHKLRVLVSGRTPMIGRLIADTLRRDRGLAVSDIVGTSVVEVAKELNPHVILLSEALETKVGRGFEVLRRLRAAVPQSRVVMLLDRNERGSVVTAFHGGARGVFCENDPIKMLARCVRKVHKGELWLTNAQLEFVLTTLAGVPAIRIVDSHGAALLSKRELDVVGWLAAGLTNSQIARQLNLSENSVRNYLARIYNKLGVSSRVEAVLYATSQRSPAERKSA
jgi:DNA-binding NarL/FixJ family response regulator